MTPFTTLAPTKAEQGSTRNSNAFNLTQSVMNNIQDYDEFLHGISLENWEEIFKNIIQKDNFSIGNIHYRNKNSRRTNVFKLIAGYATSNPKVLFNEFIQDNKLKDTKWTRIWRAATNVIGTHYSDKIPAQPKNRSPAQKTITGLFGNNNTTQKIIKIIIRELLKATFQTVRCFQTPNATNPPTL